MLNVSQKKEYESPFINLLPVLQIVRMCFRRLNALEIHPGGEKEEKSPTTLQNVLSRIFVRFTALVKGLVS